MKTSCDLSVVVFKGGSKQQPNLTYEEFCSKNSLNPLVPLILLRRTPEHNLIVRGIRLDGLPATLSVCENSFYICPIKQMTAEDFL